MDVVDAHVCLLHTVVCQSVISDKSVLNNLTLRARINQAASEPLQ